VDEIPGARINGLLSLRARHGVDAGAEGPCEPGDGDAAIGWWKDHVTLVSTKGALMSDCLHCDIHDMLEAHLQGDEADLAEIAAKVTEVLVDLILMAPPDDRGLLMADILSNLGGILLEKSQHADPTNPRSSRH
jgi:hypothetical protein